MMSKPATHSSTAPPSTIAGSKSAGCSATCGPRIAIQAEIGASINAAPSQKWAPDVNRFVQLYARMKPSTGTDRYNGQGLGKNTSVESTNASDEPNANSATLRAESALAGMCRACV